MPLSEPIGFVGSRLICLRALTFGASLDASANFVIIRTAFHLTGSAGVPEADAYDLTKFHQSSGGCIATMDFGGGCSCFYCRKGLHDSVLMHCPCWH